MESYRLYFIQPSNRQVFSNIDYYNYSNPKYRSTLNEGGSKNVFLSCSYFQITIISLSFVIEFSFLHNLSSINEDNYMIRVNH